MCLQIETRICFVLYCLSVSWQSQLDSQNPIHMSWSSGHLSFELQELRFDIACWYAYGVIWSIIYLNLLAWLLLRVDQKILRPCSYEPEYTCSHPGWLSLSGSCLIFYLYTWSNWLECKWYAWIKQKFSKTNGCLVFEVEIFNILLAQYFHLIGEEILNDNMVGAEILTVPLAQNFHFCFVVFLHLHCATMNAF